jgi:hypothetical protein
VNAWAEFVPFLSFDVEIRKVICSTKAIEPVNVRMRKAVRAQTMPGVQPVGEARPVVDGALAGRTERIDPPALAHVHSDPRGSPATGPGPARRRAQPCPDSSAKQM